MIMIRDQAWQLVQEKVKGDLLREYFVNNQRSTTFLLA